MSVTLLSLALLSLVTLVTGQDPLRPANPPTAAPTFSPALEQIIADGLSPQETLGKLLWNRPTEEVALALIQLNVAEGALKKIFDNAQASNVQDLIQATKSGAQTTLAKALDACGVPVNQVLNAVRFYLFAEKNHGLTTRAILQAAREHGKLDDAALLERVKADYPYNTLPDQAPTTLTGKLETIGDTRILYLWGTPLERGYAYGKLLARDIFTLWMNYAYPLSGFKGGYRRVAEMQDLIFYFPPEYLDELKGMVLGIRDAMPLDERLKNPLKRDLGVLDFKVGNTLSDWSEIGCSSITAWGSLTADGRPLTARNLDYFAGAARSLHQSHVVVVNAPMHVAGEAKPRHGFVSVTWVGATGVYTGMNDQGVTSLMHNTLGNYPTSTIAALPRSLAQRRALELAEADQMPQSFIKGLQQNPAVIPSNIHTSWPKLAQHTNTVQGFAAGLETDGLRTLDGGVTVRSCLDNGEGKKRDYVVVTNHFCKREGGRTYGDSRRRYTTLGEAAESATPGSVTPELMREWLQAVGHSGSVHSVVLDPTNRILYVMQPKLEDKGGPWATMQTLKLSDLYLRLEAARHREIRDF